eukprot:scaffold16833_cov17-Tisochrysis_lutea.AAC.1
MKSTFKKVDQVEKQIRVVEQGRCRLRCSHTAALEKLKPGAQTTWAELMGARVSMLSFKSLRNLWSFRSLGQLANRAFRPAQGK